ncbi:MAG: DUF4248 domain-containing protein [Prevotellaceae bacterium]|nr:DUF4248 domain-containing protein [Prevotellaceae bacterium]
MRQQEFRIRTYGRMELAQTYFPEMAAMSAWNKLKRWINNCPQLKKRLAELTDNPKARTWTPRQVEAIVEMLGEP